MDTMQSCADDPHPEIRLFASRSLPDDRFSILRRLVVDENPPLEIRNQAMQETLQFAHHETISKMALTTLHHNT